MNDRWWDEIVWKQNACLCRGRGVMDRDQAVLLSAALCSPAMMAALLASATTCKYQPLLLAPGFYFGCVSASPAQTFNKAGGVIWGCVKMSEHICWSENVQTRCVSRIINQQLLILGKQSSPQPEFLCLAPADRLHQNSNVTVYSLFYFLFLACWIFQKITNNKHRMLYFVEIKLSGFWMFICVALFLNYRAA